MRRIIIISTLLASVLISITALACGDSLYRVGKGVSYRVYTAPLPGSVLVYGRTEGAEQLADALAQSGHEVRLVDNEAVLSVELKSGSYDVVIAPYRDHTTVESSQNAAVSVDTAYLPVALNKEEKKVADLDYSTVMLADRDEIKHYLKAIHKSLKRRS